MFVPALLLCSLFPSSALAGRVAQMEASYASGFYQPVRSGTLAVESSSDGRPTALVLSVPGRKLRARVWRFRQGRCGDQIEARLAVPDEGRSTDLSLVDYTVGSCDIYVKQPWHARVRTREPDGSGSELWLEGDPDGGNVAR